VGALRDLQGQQFARLRVVELAPRSQWRSHRAHWLCVCECGNELVVPSDSLRSGNTKSCGCLSRGNLLKHFHYGSPAHTSWRSMKSRCLNPNSDKYPLYGGRGVVICERWMSFANFLADMGERPEGKTLDRIDSHGNYEPGNCRWATVVEQRKNRRDCVVA
jgi:hypothetical protein